MYVHTPCMWLEEYVITEYEKRLPVYSHEVNFNFQKLCFLTRCVYFFSVIITVNGEYYFPTPL
jgi:hypothetical protein